MDCAPIIVFVYNRADHTKQTLRLLEKNYLAKESDVYIFADGPKDNCTTEQFEKITEVRNVIRESYCLDLPFSEGDTPSFRNKYSSQSVPQPV